MLTQPTFPFSTTSFSVHWHLCYYIPHLRRTDLLSREVINFKNMHTHTVRRWCEWAGTELKQSNLSFDFIIRALSSGETQAQTSNSVNQLGQFLAACLNVPFQPTMIYKTRTTSKLAFIPTKEDRKQEISDVYRLADDCPDLTGKKVLLIDDVCTGKLTSGEILKVIKQKYPTCQVYLFTLAQTRREDQANAEINQGYFS